MLFWIYFCFDTSSFAKTNYLQKLLSEFGSYVKDGKLKIVWQFFQIVISFLNFDIWLTVAVSISIRFFYSFVVDHIAIFFFFSNFSTEKNT